MYQPSNAVRDFRAPFSATFDRNAAPDGKGYGALIDADSRLVSYFRTKREATAEARNLNRTLQERDIQYQPDGLYRCHACHRRIGSRSPSMRTDGWYYHANHTPQP